MAAAVAAESTDFTFELDPRNFGPDLVLAERGIVSVPTAVADARGPSTKLLNLTENHIETSANLEKFVVLETLILDKNGLVGLSSWWKEETGPLARLKTLWMNNNNIGTAELAPFLEDVETLSKLGIPLDDAQPLLPDILDLPEAKAEEYRRHRLESFSSFLRFLDATPDERGDAGSHEKRALFGRRGASLTDVGAAKEGPGSERGKEAG